jgi:hypothetical protein
MSMNRLIPMLPVKSMPRSVEFYQKLAFSVERRSDEWGWAMLSFDECRLMVDQSINVHRDAPRQSVDYLYSESIVECHQRVRGNGLDVPDLDETFYGLSEFDSMIPMATGCGSGRPRRPRLNDPNGDFVTLR